MTEFLNPGRKLVDEVVDWLCGRVERDPSGARSLAHLMVVVPTAQSGRNLRLALAKKAAEMPISLCRRRTRRRSPRCSCASFPRSEASP